jgi:ABC-type glycerol-3-phosphate transport system substrate-binding protein
MKKVIAIVAIATSLVACGGASTAPAATTDSTAVAADTTVKADSTIAPAVDSTKK